MGDMADMAINGEMCSYCGTTFEEENGFPLLCPSCWNEAVKDVKRGKNKNFTKDRSGNIITIDSYQESIMSEI